MCLGWERWNEGTGTSNGDLNKNYDSRGILGIMEVIQNKCLLVKFECVVKLELLVNFDFFSRSNLNLVCFDFLFIFLSMLNFY